MKTFTDRSAPVMLVVLLLLACPLVATAGGYGYFGGYYGVPHYGYQVRPAYPYAYVPRPYVVQPYGYGGYYRPHSWRQHGYERGYRHHRGHGGHYGGYPRSGFSFHYSR